MSNKPHDNKEIMLIKALHSTAWILGAHYFYFSPATFTKLFRTVEHHLLCTNISTNSNNLLVFAERKDDQSILTNVVFTPNTSWTNYLAQNAVC